MKNSVETVKKMLEDIQEEHKKYYRSFVRDDEFEAKMLKIARETYEKALNILAYGCEVSPFTSTRRDRMYSR